MVDDIATATATATAAAAANLDATTSKKRKHRPMKGNRSKKNNPMVDSGDNNCETESVITLKGRKLKQYVLEEKLDIIDYAKIIGNRAAGREFNVAESSIREWRKNEQRLRSMFQTTPERSRLDGGGRRPVSENLEKNLLQYVTSRSDNETALTWHDIKEKANALWKDICDQNPEYSDRGFTANMGWVARFVRRNNITLQVTNSMSTITPKLVNNDGNSNINIIDDCNSVCCSALFSTMTDSSSALPASTTSPMSDVVVNNNMYFYNDDVKMNTAAAKTKTTATTAASTSSPVIISASATIATTTTVDTVAATNDGIISAKKRRKNFTPKKVVPNDIICLAANNGTDDNPIVNSTATISPMATTVTTTRE